jgi:hypothetical protein
MRGAILSFPQYVFMASCLIKHKDNFAFTVLPYPFPKRSDRKRKLKKKLYIADIHFWGGGGI